MRRLVEVHELERRRDLVRVVLVERRIGGRREGRHPDHARQRGALRVADPQVNYTLQEWQFLIITHDGLVGFKRTGGAEGATIVPDLATAVPTPTDNGRTYQFTLRPGIKFSNGKTVTGQDVKATFERLFKMRQPQRGHLVQRDRGRRRVRQDAQDM